MSMEAEPDGIQIESLRRISWILGIVVALTTIISFLIEQPLIGSAMGGLLGLGAIYYIIRYVLHRNVGIASIVAVLLIMLSFFMGWVLSGPESFLSRMINDPSILDIREASYTTFPFDGFNNPEGGFGAGYLAVSHKGTPGEGSTSFKFDYHLGNEPGAYAGFAVTFAEAQDLTEFNTLEMKLLFSSDSARIRVLIKDSLGGQDGVILGNGNIVTAKNQVQAVSLDLDTYFPSIARSSIHEIVLDANGSFVNDSHSITISEIRFTK